MPHTADVLVLGAGAAGLMAALYAGRRGRRVLVLDPGPHPGRKILISGGGRCNFTNTHTRAENFLGQNPLFARSALARYPPADFLQLVDAHNIAWHEKTLGQLFCNGPARQIVTLLERECGQAGVLLQCGTNVSSVTHTPAGFTVQTSTGTLHAASLIVATGGLSIPKLGVSGFGYDLARQFGHTVLPPRPALVPLVFSPTDAAHWCDLTGLSTHVVASAPSASTARPRTPHPSFPEKLLLTHRGLSGPAVLQISSYWQPGAPLYFDLAPGQAVFTPLLAPGAPNTPNSRRDRSTLLAALRHILPARLADRWLTLHLPAKPGIGNADLTRLEAALHSWTLLPDGTEGFSKAEVTAGGVGTGELDARTLQSQRLPGLFFVGEVVDITGWLGGYNFQWAWSSAAAAGNTA